MFVFETELRFLLDRYDINPLVGVIPRCEDPQTDHYWSILIFGGRVYYFHPVMVINKDINEGNGIQ